MLKKDSDPGWWCANIPSSPHLTEMLALDLTAGEMGTYLFGFPALANPRNQPGWRFDRMKVFRVERKVVGGDRVPCG
jgi:hypothetical protein